MLFTQYQFASLIREATTWRFLYSNAVFFQEMNRESRLIVKHDRLHCCERIAFNPPKEGAQGFEFLTGLDQKILSLLPQHHCHRTSITLTHYIIRAKIMTRIRPPSIANVPALNVKNCIENKNWQLTSRSSLNLKEKKIILQSNLAKGHFSVERLAFATLEFREINQIKCMWQWNNLVFDCWWVLP